MIYLDFIPAVALRSGIRDFFQTIFFRQEFRRATACRGLFFVFRELLAEKFLSELQGEGVSVVGAQDTQIPVGVIGADGQLVELIGETGAQAQAP